MPFHFCDVCRRNFQGKPRNHLYAKSHVGVARAWVKRVEAKVAALRLYCKRPIDTNSTRRHRDAHATSSSSASSIEAFLLANNPDSFWCSFCDVDIQHRQRFAWYVRASVWTLERRDAHAHSLFASHESIAHLASDEHGAVVRKFLRTAIGPRACGDRFTVDKFTIPVTAWQRVRFAADLCARGYVCGACCLRF